MSNADRRLRLGHRLRSRLTRWAAGLSIAGCLLLPSRGHAWDPSTTHLGMLERSVLDSAMHVRWMDNSQLTRGLFTPLRLDPERLDPETRRVLLRALRRVHAASGAEPLGGPGACPGASAPAVTRARCVEGDLWETTALGWLELGVIVESVPAERLLHHFVDRDEPAAPRWSDTDLRPALLRSKHAKVGGTLAERFNGEAFEGSGRSAVAWLEDANDRFAPPALTRHLQLASVAESRGARDHHLAMALLCSGALLHVLQDLSVPAHARGDVSASFLPLSDIPGDRGLPLQELARDAFGRSGLPKPVALAPRATPSTAGVPLADTLRQHILGGDRYAGLVHASGRMNFSESSLPASILADRALDAEAVAAILLADAGLDPAERIGARLGPWPSDRGYLYSGTGRQLAAYRIDDDDQLQLWIDRPVYRAQMRQLIPAGIEAGRSALDLIYAAWPSMAVDVAGRSLTLTPGETWKDATLTVMVEDGEGARRPIAAVDFTGVGPHRIVDAWPQDTAEDSRIIAVLHNEPGRLPAVVEHVLDIAPAEDAAETEPVVPRPRAQPPTTRANTVSPVRANKVGTPDAPPPTDGTVAQPDDDAAVEPSDGTVAQPDDTAADAPSDGTVTPSDDAAADDSSPQ